MLEVLRQDYIRTARAKGLRNRLSSSGHALRNALIPVITVIGFQLGALMGGSAIIEVIFGLNGVGNTLLQAIFNRDYPLVQAATLYLATIFVLINLVVDVLYAYLDPTDQAGHEPRATRDDASDASARGRALGAPWWRCRGAGATRSACVGAVIVLLTVIVALAAPLIAPTTRPRRTATRLLPPSLDQPDGHRRAGTGHLLAHRLRRPRLAPGRHHLRRDRPGSRRRPRLCGRVLRRALRCLADAGGRHHVRLPGPGAGHRHRRPARRQPHQRHDRHRHRLRPGLRPGHPRLGAGCDERAVRRGRARGRIGERAA